MRRGKGQGGKGTKKEKGEKRKKKKEVPGRSSKRGRSICS